MNRYRVFVSYSHEDENLVEEVVRLLDEDPGLTPMWDRNFVVGRPFSEAIKRYIAHAHVFLPVVTKASSERGWVHEEIGYATALHVPMMPVAIGVLPEAMMAELHARVLKGDPETWKAQLPYREFDDLVRGSQSAEHALYECAELAERRAEMMADYANGITQVKLGFHAETTHAFVRQQGGLSSFHIPTETTDHRVWRERFGEHPKSVSHCEGQREERLALEKHARAAGCRIIVQPQLDYALYGPKARKVRLKWLLRFLEDTTVESLEVAFDSQVSGEYSWTIVGDWFAAVSVSATLWQGFRQTIFTRHAPSLMRSIERFDSRFVELLEESGWTAADCRERAIQEIKSIIAGIDA